MDQPITGSSADTLQWRGDRNHARASMNSRGSLPLTSRHTYFRGKSRYMNILWSDQSCSRSTFSSTIPSLLRLSDPMFPCCHNCMLPTARHASSSTMARAPAGDPLAELGCQKTADEDRRRRGQTEDSVCGCVRVHLRPAPSCVLRSGSCVPVSRAIDLSSSAVLSIICRAGHF